DASQAMKEQMMAIYGFDRPYHEQFLRWLWRAVHGDLGASIATSRPVIAEVSKAVGNTLVLASVAELIGFVLDTFFSFVVSFLRDTAIDKLASFVSVIGVSVPHYWLGMILVIIFAATLGWLPPTGAGPGGSEAWTWDWEHTRHLVLPAVTMSVI